MRRVVGLVIVWMGVAALPGCVGPEPIDVFCAASLVPLAERAAAEFTSATDVPVALHVGGSGVLLAQIGAGARGDVFIAADMSYLEACHDAGPAERPRALGGQRAVLLTGDPRLAAAGTIAEILGLGPRVSAADRDSAAIGRFLAEALPPELHARFEAAVRDRGVTRATVEAAANDVALGVADAAIVWDRVARRHPRLSASVPEELATRSSRWGVAVLRDSTRPELAEAFVAVLADVADGPR